MTKVRFEDSVFTWSQICLRFT